MASKSRLGVIFIVVLISSGVPAAWNLYMISRDMLWGDLSAKRLTISPINTIVRVPDVPAAEAHMAVGRIGADFAQVYFPAQDTAHLQNAYIHARTLDPWSRPSRYAPLVILACSITICRLNYGPASILHMLLQTALFFLALYGVLVPLRVRRYWPLLAFVGILLFITPVGLSWFERGQFTLYVGSSYALFVAGIVARKPALVALSAVFAFVKWTAFPAIAVIGLAFLLASESIPDLKERLRILVPFPLVVGFLFLSPALVSRGSGLFLDGVITQELHDNPTGLSLLKLMPRSIEKLVPMALLVLGYLNGRMHRGSTSYLIPFSIGVAACMIVYPTRANDYSAPILFGFIPLALWWRGRSEVGARRPTHILLYLYAGFAILASLSTSVTHSIPAMTVAYLAFSLVFAAVPAVLAHRTAPGRQEGTV